MVIFKPALCSNNKLTATWHALKNIEFWKDILNIDDLINKLFDIISDNPKLKKLSADPRLLKEGELQRFLRKLKDKYFFTKEIYDKIYHSGTKPPSIYGIPRIHKLNVKKKTYLSAPITTISLSFLLICLTLSFLYIIGQKIH